MAVGIKHWFIIGIIQVQYPFGTFFKIISSMLFYRFLKVDIKIVYPTFTQRTQRKRKGWWEDEWHLWTRYLSWRVLLEGALPGQDEVKDGKQEAIQTCGEPCSNPARRKFWTFYRHQWWFINGKRCIFATSWAHFVLILFILSEKFELRPFCSVTFLFTFLFFFVWEF